MFDHALRTFDQMEELGTPRSVLSFNALLMAFSYGLLVRSFCESGSRKSGLTVLKEMEEKNVEITAITYTILLQCFFYKKECIEEADKIWKEMAEKGLLDVTAFNVRIMQTGPPEDVLSLIDEIKTLGLIPDAVTYNNLLICYCNHGLIEEAKKVLRKTSNGDVDKGFEVFKDSLKRDKLPNFTSMKYLVQGLFEKSKLEESKQVIDIAKKKCRPNFLNMWKKIERGLGLNVKKQPVPIETSSLAAK
ncbi:hypothetical protein MKX03_035282 [Papaver bracteatum]|nr:hypothetical protein MKX03_035282 [Papaver bracteatum]